MKTRILSVAFTGAFALAALGGTALAASENHTEPGTPGDKNCAGQTYAYLAQQSGVQLDAPGIGNCAVEAGLSVKEVKELVDSYCAGEL